MVTTLEMGSAWLRHTEEERGKINKAFEPEEKSEKQDWNGILLPKLFWPTVRKNCSSDWEKLLKFEAEGREFAKCLRSLKVS